MKIPASKKLFELAGYMLADALVRASEAGEGRAFDPYAGIVRNGKFEIADFSPATKEHPDDGALAQRYLQSHRDEFQAWALVQDTLAVHVGAGESTEGLSPDAIDARGLDRRDAIAVLAWEADMQDPFTVMQRYEPRRSGRFKITGTPDFAYEGEFLTEEDLKKFWYLDDLRRGFMNHEEAATLWENWT